MAKERMFLELPGANLKGFSLGDSVTATVSGKLVELSAPRKFDFDDEVTPPSVGIEVTGKATLVPKAKKKNAFSDMADEDDKEGD